jgi:hypothetical protein
VNSDADNGTVNAALSGFGTLSASNDNYANAKIVSAGTYSDVVTTLTATTETTDPRPDSICVSGSADTRNHTVWYFYTPNVSGTMTVDTLGSDYDTVLSVWTSRRGGFTSIGCSDDIQLGQNLQSSLTMPVTGGVTYEIMVGGYTAQDAGTLQFHLSGPAPLSPPPPILTLSQPRPPRSPRVPAASVPASGQAIRVPVALTTAGIDGQAVTIECTSRHFICSAPGSITAADGDVVFDVAVRTRAKRLTSDGSRRKARTITVKARYGGQQAALTILLWSFQ